MSKNKILFQLSGSIACFKACQLLSSLLKEGYEVEVVATRSALNFVGAATLEGLTGRKVHSEVFENGGHMNHIRLVRWADLILLCPATANMINKLASGIGDDLVSTLFLAHDFKKPYLIAPAMNVSMFHHPATQASIAKLRDWGITVLDAGVGSLACGESGEGRMLEPEDVLREIQARLHADERPARRLKVLVTSGGTREPIDGVRSIANTSTGQTGVAIARHFAQRGHEVTLVRAKDSVSAPRLNALRVRDFTTFADLRETLKNELGSTDYDAVIHAAAVSDFSVDRVEVNGRTISPCDKLDSETTEALSLHLKRNPKIVDELRSYSRNSSLRVVAFKLTNTKDEQARLQAVQRLARHARPDFILQNDLSDIDSLSGRHVARLFSAKDPENPIVLAEGRTKDEAAAALENILLNSELSSEGGRQWF